MKLADLGRIMILPIYFLFVLIGMGIMIVIEKIVRMRIEDRP